MKRESGRNNSYSVEVGLCPGPDRVPVASTPQRRPAVVAAGGTLGCLQQFALDTQSALLFIALTIPVQQEVQVGALQFTGELVNVRCVFALEQPRYRQFR